ncbi:hypothetical protein pqer_cds_975 [Pandoravirus quercus]|uniref:Uncharacterized protein n=2 Tax=Pandoravirus TaxID=2060084 RepID=A0A2U7UAC1_9VIRU|nr:hypothetical protein pqer_cds_975 [Pandoravirus quercus]AVK75397.1 hypothetical protein pqer_cds_975 [Pandoravirus quercus]QBZ81575.1 hypothetical protein pclt_cds_989 [Pandoravirus celtis]
MSTPAEQQTVVAATAVPPAPTTTVVAAAPPRRSVPWGWIIGGIVASLIAAMVLTAVILAIVFESRRRRPNNPASFLPVTPVGPSSRGVAAPVGAPLAAGHYKIRWAPTGLYLGVNEISGNPAVLVAAGTAPTWTYAAATAAGAIGGSLTSSTGSALSTGTATALVGPVPVYVSGGTAVATGSWVAARDPSGSATLPGTIYNAALGGCLRPNRDGGIGSPVVLAPSCSATEHGWVFEPATA